jgi:hypothetical protein
VSSGRKRAAGRTALALVAASFTTQAGGAVGGSTLQRGWLLLLKGRAPATVAATPRYLAWEYEPTTAHPNAALVERDRRNHRVRVLASSVLPQFGLAATTSSDVYAAARGSVTQLRAVRHDGSGATILSRSLAAPIASRGELVAWAEQLGEVQRVVVQNMRTGRRWVAAHMPRCVGTKCYRIDAVTLADEGVVFDRGAVGTQPSLIVRRRFGDARPTTVTVPNDPQPELAPSSSGALYFWLRHGWMRWDFGARRPRPARSGARGSWIVAEEQGRLLLRSGSQCRPRLIVRRRGAPDRPIAVPSSTPVSPRDFGRLCRLMTGFTWHGRRVLTSWAVIPRISLDAHTDAGLAGVVIETAVP